MFESFSVDGTWRNVVF